MQTIKARRKDADFQGISEERLKGLEPSTFCMASGATDLAERSFCLQIGRF